MLMNSRQFSQNIWSMACRHHKLNDKIIRSKSLQDQRLYPKTCYSPKTSPKYDAGFVNVYETYFKEEMEKHEDPSLKEVVDHDLGYTKQEVNEMNKIIRENVEACNNVADYEDTDRIRARKAKEKTEKIQRFRTADAHN